MVKGFLLHQSKQIVFRNQTDYSASSVGDWESTVVSLASFVDVINSVDSVNAHYLLAHELLSSDQTVAVWNSWNKNWHLFGTDSFLVQTSVAERTHKVRHSDCNNNWNEDVDILGSFHYDNNQRISHSSVASKHRTHSQYHICGSVAC